MRKRGLDYQDLVALVESALDPGANIRVGEWIIGPDGGRDLDVSIRGQRDGAPFFGIIECKDWRKTVGIGQVDAIDSKRQDLAADFAAIYTNSGFSIPALRKGQRVGIGMFAAVAEGDSRSRAKAYSLALGKVFEVVALAERIIEPAGQDFDMPIDLNVEDAVYEGSPIHNWVVDQVQSTLLSHPMRLDEPTTFVLEYRFDPPADFQIRGELCRAVGMLIDVEIAIKWMAQPIAINADLARIDLHTGLVTIPANTAMYLDLPTGTEGWEPIEQPSEDELRATGRLLMHVRAWLAAGLLRAKGDSPELGRLVISRIVHQVTT